MAIDFKSFRECAPHVLKAAKPILLRGRHGIGKSEVVYQIAEALDLPVVERRASQMTEGDLLGMPSPAMGSRLLFSVPLHGLSVPVQSPVSSSSTRWTALFWKCAKACLS